MAMNVQNNYALWYSANSGHFTANPLRRRPGLLTHILTYFLRQQLQRHD